MKSSFGLDIGIDVMKVVHLSKSGATFSLESAAYAPSPRPGILSESSTDLEMVAEKMNELLKNADISTREANISIPQSQVYTKIIEMPKLSDRELSAALAYEMDQYIPLPLDQVRIDWQVLSEIEVDGEKKLNVLIIAASLAIIQKYGRILQFAKINSDTIETEIVSVQRALSPLLSTQEPVMLLHIGSSSLDVAILSQNMLEMVYTIGLGGLAVIRGAAADMGKNPQEMDHVSFLYSLQQDVFTSADNRALTPIVDSILGDIRKAILAYRNKYNKNVVEILLSGEYAHMPGFASYLQQKLGLHIEVANPWKAHSIENVPDELQLRSAGFAVVVGLAMRGYV